MFWLRNSNGSSRSWWPSSKRLIPSVDVFISLLQVIMMKSSSFLWDLHHPTIATRGKTLEERISTKLASGGELKGKVHEVLHELYFSEFIECNM
jgi:hypothetical protein